MINNEYVIEDRLLSKISSLYYNQNYTQQQIASRLHLSRPKVSRLLKKARERGIIKISVTSPSNIFVELENSLEKKYELEETLIVESDINGQFVKRQIGSAAATYLHRTVSKGDIVGVTWGTTLQAMVDSLSNKKIDDIHIVQALGGVGPPEAKAHAADISRRLAQNLQARLTLLPAPGIVGSTEAKKVLASDRQVQSALNLFSEIDILFVGLGAINTNPVLDRSNDEISLNLNEEIINSDAVGDIALHFFDVNGNEINSAIKDLVIGISIEELKQIDTVVGIAGGKEKTDVIQGALNGNLIDVLITDHHTAETLIDE